MSYSKRAWEDENEGFDPFTRCEVCREYKDNCICSDIATEGHVFHAGDESALTDAIDSHVTRLPPESDELEDDAFFAHWAGEMVKAEVSRGMLDKMWERIKVRLDNLHKAEQLLRSVFGKDVRIVDK